MRQYPLSSLTFSILHCSGFPEDSIEISLRHKQGKISVDEQGFYLFTNDVNLYFYPILKNSVLNNLICQVHLMEVEKNTVTNTFGSAQIAQSSLPSPQPLGREWEVATKWSGKTSYKSKSGSNKVILFFFQIKIWNAKESEQFCIEFKSNEMFKINARTPKRLLSSSSQEIASPQITLLSPLEDTNPIHQTVNKKRKTSINSPLLVEEKDSVIETTATLPSSLHQDTDILDQFLSEDFIFFLQ